MGFAELLTEDEAELFRWAEAGGLEAGRFVSAPKRGGRAETKLMSWQEFLDSTPESRNWTVDGILPDSGLAVLAGRANEGKSTLAIHLCRAVASGQSFLGRQTQQKPVVYVMYEMTLDYVRSLLSSADVPDRAYFANRPAPVFELEIAASLMNHHRIGCPGLMIIDSFRGAFKLSGDGENSAGVAGVLLRRLQDLAVSKDWLIMVIHHRNKKRDQTGSDSLSGTGDWTAAPDVIWTWERPDPDKKGTLAIDGRIPPVEPLSIQLTPEECRYIGTGGGGEEENEKALILDSLGFGRKTADQLASELDIPPGTVRKRLQTLETQQKIFRTGEGKKNNPHLYQRIVSAQSPPLGEETKQRHHGRIVNWDLILDL